MIRRSLWVLGMGWVVAMAGSTARADGTESALPEGSDDRTNALAVESSLVAKSGDAPARSIRLPVFVPRPRGAPEDTVGGGTRKPGADGGPILLALAPQSSWLTAKASPVLYWYLFEPAEAPIEVEIWDETGREPLLATRIAGPQRAGIHRIELADHGTQLVAGTVYRWYVKLLRDPDRRADDLVSGSRILRIAASDLSREVGEAGAAERPFALSANGVWYDALDAFSRRADGSPPDPAAGRQRLALLQQVGISLPDANSSALPEADAP